MLCSRTNNFHLQINNINNHVINVIYNIIIRSSVTCIHYKEAKSLLQKQVIQHLPTLPVGFYSNMFMVPKKGGGQRPVINLKYLNHFVKSEHFKMEGLHTVKTLLRKNDWMAKIDPEQIHSTLLLLENAGFIINNKKSLLDPTQETEFLVMIINSVKMDISLPGESLDWMAGLSSGHFVWGVSRVNSFRFKLRHLSLGNGLENASSTIFVVVDERFYTSVSGFRHLVLVPKIQSHRNWAISARLVPYSLPMCWASPLQHAACLIWGCSAPLLDGP